MENKFPNRKDLRLKYYDYSQAGYYFVTICTELKRHLFGEIVDGIMILNDAGRMIERWYFELHNKYYNIELPQYIIMPNHVHFIIAIAGDDQGNISQNSGTHTGVPLQTIIQWFKTMTTNQYIKGVKNGEYPPFEKRIWQRNYFEHIIRNDRELQEIYEYIVNNPAKWELDKYRSPSRSIL